jgi:hypothetical protein
LDPGWVKIRIRDKHPGSAILKIRVRIMDKHPGFFYNLDILGGLMIGKLQFDPKKIKCFFQLILVSSLNLWIRIRKKMNTDPKHW